jgi:hypothetical protein
MLWNIGECVERIAVAAGANAPQRAGPPCLGMVTLPA